MRVFTQATLDRWQQTGEATLTGHGENDSAQLRWRSGKIEHIRVKASKYTPPPLPSLAPVAKTYTTREFKVTVCREVALSEPVMDTPESVFKAWHEVVPTASWWQEGKEQFVVFTVNTRRRLTGFNLVSMGMLDSVQVHPREVFRPAIIANASAVILAHNHPSGDPQPSEADIKVTRDLLRAGQLLRIEVLDHIVIGAVSPERQKAYSSLRELGYFY